EQPSLAAADEGREQVDDLDAGLEKLSFCRKIGHRRSVAVNRPIVVGMHGPAAIDRLADQIEHAAERSLADGHLHGRTGINALLPADHAVGAAQRDAPHAATAEML